jgi:ATP-dependent protease HslVU (ClpYQ) peptidase subunit
LLSEIFMESFHATTIVSVRRDGRVVIGGDGRSPWATP